MDRELAINKIKETFENSFSKERFVNFIKELLNRIDGSKAFHARGYVKEKYKKSTGIIKTYERIGTYTDSNDNKIDVLIVYLGKDNSIERARTTLRNFVADYLKTRGEKDAALVAFVSPNLKDWRFSLVKMDYQLKKDKVKQEFTPARRFSFLVGENENSHTAQSQLVPILTDDINNPTLKQLEEAFNIETVTKEFFKKYHDLFLRFKDLLDDVVKKDKKIEQDFKKKKIDTADFAKKTLGQIIFLYFLQKKGWFGVKRGEKWGSGSKRFLRELFNKKHGNYKNFFNNVLEPLFYEALRLERPKDYYDKFECRIPFLNGGLFDPFNDYDWQDTDILISNELFSNNNPTKEGDKGDGILDIFDRYNFTVKEDEPFEKEVAIDPEMLGKVFENLLKVKDRKSKGTYYTPREIVHYMCQQSLINYLYTELNPTKKTLFKEDAEQGKLLGKSDPKQLKLSSKNKEIISKEDIEKLIKYGETVIEHDNQVVKKGKETSKYSFKFSKDIRDNAELIDEKLKNIRICDPAIGSGAFPVGMMNEIIRARNALTNYIKDKESRTIYDFKRHAIQNCLYGVDIDSGAIEIAKLRLWLSLIVDEDDIKQIKPLPNLDYKIMQGNSLIGIEKEKMGMRDMFFQDSMEQLEKLKGLYSNESHVTKKEEYKNQVEELISRVTNGHRDFDFEIYFSEIFYEKGGFDVIIANPPYVSYYSKQAQPLLKEEIGFYKRNYDFILDKKKIGRFGTVMFFLEKGIKICKERGSLIYIVDMSIFENPYFDIRRFFTDNYLIKEIVMGLAGFEEVHSGQILLRVQKSKPDNNLIVYKDKSFKVIMKTNQNKLISNAYRWDMYDQNTIVEKIEQNSKSLVVSFPKRLIRTGITFTGKKEEFLVNDKNQRKYKIKPVNIYDLYEGSKAFRSPYETPRPTKKINYDLELVRELNKIYTEQNKSNKSPMVIGLGDLFVFNNPRILVRLSDVRITATYTEDIACSDLSLYSISSKNSHDDRSSYNLKFILAILNSKLMTYYALKKKLIALGERKTPQIRLKSLKSLPIRSTDNQKPFINLVDKILTITKDDDYLKNSTKQTNVREYEKQIDKIVYDLYGLTKEEIKIVESKV